MTYLFFDIECANCDNGVGKICSFGYVLCDNKFNVLEKKDLLINPNAKFSYGVMSKKFITLGYPQSEFLCQPKFNERYPDIKDILTKPDQIVIGHAVDNDVNFILGDCDRYHLPIFEYDFYDSQELYRVHNNRSLHQNLSAICEELNITVGNAHRSDEDAEMTMQVTKVLCQNQNIGLPELLNQYPTCQHKMSDLIKKHNLRKEFYLFKQFLNHCEREKTLKNEKIEGKTFCFSRKVETMDYGITARIIQNILDCGGNYTNDVEKADYFIRGKGGCDRLTRALGNNNLATMTLTALCKIMEINYTQINPLNMTKYLIKHPQENNKK